jgi:virginiamycin A acetyltransferase
MTELEYAEDDLPAATGTDKLYLRAKTKGFWKRKLFRRSQKRFGIRDDLVRLHTFEHYGIRVGKFTYGFKQLCYRESMLAEVGAFCSIAKNVTIPDSNHPMDTVTTHPFFYSKVFGLAYMDVDVATIARNNKKIVIGHDVWVGTGAIILTGVNIGTGAVIGAGAVVTKDVPPYAIVAGVPAKILRYRFDEETIQKLLASKWWTWPDAKIKEHIPDFFNTPEFLTKVTSR